MKAVYKITASGYPITVRAKATDKYQVFLDKSKNMEMIHKISGVLQSQVRFELWAKSIALNLEVLDYGH